MTSPTGAHVTTVYADVLPDASNFGTRLRAALSTLGPVDVRVDPDASGFNTRLRAALGGLPAVSTRVNVDPDLTGFNARLSARLAALPTSSVTVGVNVTVTPASTARIAALRATLASLGHTSVAVTVTMPTATAVGAQIGAAAAAAFATAFRATLASLPSPPVPGPGPARSAAAGRLDSGAYARTFRQGIEDATRNLPTPRISLVRLPQVDREINALHRDLDRLSRQRIGVDIDAAAALAEMRRLQAEAARLSALSPNIDVRTNLAATSARILLLQQQLNRLGSTSPNVRVTSSGFGPLQAAVIGSTSRMQLLITAGLALGPAIVPAAAAAAAAVASIGGAAISAVSGIGVGILALSGVVGAVKALNDAQNDSAKTGATLARQDKQLASGADQVKSAVASLANTRAQAASQARQSAQAIADAERGLAGAQRDALRAQQDLTRARENAVDAYEDLDSAAANNAIQIERANLQLQDAEKALQAVKNDPKESRRRIEAELAYREARQQVIDLTTRQGRLAEEQAKAQKVGVEGSDQVVAAQERIRDSQERVRDAERALTEARVSAAEQARQSAFSIAQAQQAVVSAQRSAATAAITAAATSGAAMDTLREKMDALSPAGRRFAEFLFSQKSLLLDLRGVAETGVLPGFQRGIEAVLPYRPALTGFVRDIAEGLGRIAERALTALTQPQWRPFFTYIGNTAVPTMHRLAESTGNVALGLANVVVAFAPMQRTVGDGLLNLTARFERWSATLRTNRDFQDFIEYAITRGPIVLRTLGDLAGTILHIAEASAPVGDVVLTVLSGIAAAINAIPVPVLTGLLATLTALRIVNLITPMVATFGAAMATAGTGAVTMRAALSGTVAFLGGPWTIAIAAATVGIGYLIAQTQKHAAEQRRSKEATEDYAASVAEVGEAADKARRQEAARFLLQEGILAQADRAGVAADLVTDAYLGEADAMARLNEELQRRKAQLEAQLVLDAKRHGVESENYKNTERQLSATNGLIETYGNFQTTLQDARNAQGLFNKAMGEGAVQAANLTASERALSDANRILHDSTATVEQKVTALKTAMEALQKQAEDQVEAEERYQRAVLNTKESLDENGASLELNTRKGLDNRDSLQEQLRASVAWYKADVAAGVQIEEATRRHNERVEALKRETLESAGTKAAAEKLRGQVDSLVKIYGQVPDNVETSIKTKGLVEVYRDLVTLQIAQRALAEGLTPQQAEQKYRFLIPGGDGTNTSRLATGGPVYGPGGATDDQVPAFLPTSRGVVPFRLSNGEWVHQTAAVDYYGHPTMRAINERRIPKELLRGFATGGAVQWPFVVNVSGTHVPTLDEAKAAVIPKGPSVGSGGIGSAKMMAVLRAAFPGLALYSGFRPGSRTASGGLSYHARTAPDGSLGRAVDLPPRFDVFDFIYNNYFAQTRELIWLGRYLKNIHNGRHHVYNRTLLSQHGVAGMPNAHIHWALAGGGPVVAPRMTLPYLQRDSGGVLPPGLSIVDNSTGRNEWVINDQQARALAGGGGRMSRDVHIYPQRADFDLNDLRAEMARQDTLDRVGRPY